MVLDGAGINGENYIVCAPTGTWLLASSFHITFKVAGLIISHHLQEAKLAVLLLSHQEKLRLERSPNPNYRNSIRIYDLLCYHSQALNVYMDLRQKDAISVLSEITRLPADV